MDTKIKHCCGTCKHMQGDSLGWCKALKIQVAYDMNCGEEKYEPREVKGD